MVRSRYSPLGGILSGDISPFRAAVDAAAAAAGLGTMAPPQGPQQGDPIALRAVQRARAEEKEEERRQLSLAVAASNRLVRDEQDREYRESLAEDARKEREREEEETMRKIAEEGKRERRRREATEKLREEPAEDDPDAAAVAFRMPATRRRGASNRVVRRFRRTDGEGQLVKYLRAECDKALRDVEC